VQIGISLIGVLAGRVWDRRDRDHLPLVDHR
jgi:hypothetical protein